MPLAAVVEMHFKTGRGGWVDAVHGREWIRGKSLKVSSLCPLIRRKLTSETVRWEKRTGTDKSAGIWDIDQVILQLSVALE